MIRIGGTPLVVIADDGIGDVVPNAIREQFGGRCSRESLVEPQRALLPEVLQAVLSGRKLTAIRLLERLLRGQPLILDRARHEPQQADRRRKHDDQQQQKHGPQLRVVTHARLSDHSDHKRTYLSLTVSMILSKVAFTASN